MLASKLCIRGVCRHVISRLKREDRGIALAAVALLGTFLVLLTVVVSRNVLVETNQVGIDRSWEQVVHVAESGAESALYELEQDETWNTGDSQASLGSKTAIVNTADAKPAADVMIVPEGEVVVVKPFDDDVVYSVGYTPSRDASNRRLRVVKTEYQQLPAFNDLQFAVLTDGDIEMDWDGDADEGTLDILGTQGDIHANGLIEGEDDGGSLPHVAGNASATGNITEVLVDGTTTTFGPAQTIPPVQARAYFPFAEYVLCPDGSVHRGPANGGMAATPCADPADILGFSPYLGWEFTPPVVPDPGEWRHEGSTATDGVYYAYQTNLDLRNGKPIPWNVTLVAESDNNDCDGLGGQIRIRPEGENLTLNARAGDLVFLAEGEFRIDDGDFSTIEINGVVAWIGEGEIEADNGSVTINGALLGSSGSASCVTDDELLELESDDGGSLTVVYNGGMSLYWTGPPYVGNLNQSEL